MRHTFTYRLSSIRCDVFNALLVMKQFAVSFSRVLKAHKFFCCLPAYLDEGNYPALCYFMFVEHLYNSGTITGPK
jgi:hypothetical protein